MTSLPFEAAGCLLDGPEPLVALLRAEGWRVVGPVLHEGSLAYRPIESAAEMPRAVADEAEGGRYRLIPGRPDSWFDYTLPAQGWKRYLFPPRQKLWEAQRTPGGFEIQAPAADWPRTAFLGVRACELAAIQVQDAVFDAGPYRDPGYATRRRDTLVVAVHCGRATATCFCASVGTGPRAGLGYDLALTELFDAAGHRLLVESGSPAGAALLAQLPVRPVGPADLAAAREAVAATARQQHRRLPADIAKVIAEQPEHPRWDQVASRCLSCANCTMVCPTCFCSDLIDETDLAGERAERWRQWDSCFSIDFSYVHGGAVRRSVRSRYRQWLSHKLSTWHEQFGHSGCVGCGRCIAWCPVGIDLTAESAALAGGV